MAENRDKLGRFGKGHPPLNTQPGKDVGGRRKTLTGEVRDALKIAEDAMPDIIDSMIKRAKGEEECPVAVRQAAAEYLCDRIYGKPNQPLSGNGKLFEILVRWDGNRSIEGEGEDN